MDGWVGAGVSRQLEEIVLGGVEWMEVWEGR